ncbi:MAG: sugar phosphate isomerase/epimerase [Clostridia bacterium]|nr:sugar phosphate isomerase/epimerase [Clostridia bacterium]
MKIAFSTIGCPEWTFDEIFAVANDLRYDGVEIRGVGREMYAPNIKQLTDGTLEKKTAKSGLKVCCLTSGATFATHEGADRSVEEAKAYVDLADRLGVPYVRIMSTDKPYYDGGDIKLCERLFADLVKYAEKTSVTPLIETNGLFVDTSLLKSFLETTGGGALWDIHHPYRFGGEKVTESYENLKSFVKHVHIKDSVVEKGKTSYRIVGYGDVPIVEAIALLKGDGFDGYLTMEWVKRWHKELEEPGVVLAHYPFFMRRYAK